MNEPLHRARIGAERRRHPRVPLKLWVHYAFHPKGHFAQGPHQSESLAEDLGTRGLSLRSDHDLPTGQFLQLTLYLPPEGDRANPGETLIYPEDQCLPAVVLGRVVWSKMLPEGEYLLGVEFLEAGAQDRHRLKAFLVEYQLDAPDSALYT